MAQQKPDRPFLTGAKKRIYDENPLSLWFWRANQGACIDCTARDGRKYFYPDALKLKRPHSNCKCMLQPVEAIAASTKEIRKSRDRDIQYSSSLEAGTVVPKDAGKLLHDMYGPKEKNHWHTNPIEGGLGIESPFLAKGLQEKVQRILKQKSFDYAYCPQWSNHFRRRAEEYSFWNAFVDSYRYGSNAHREIIKRIENEITGADCHFGKFD